MTEDIYRDAARQVNDLRSRLNQLGRRGEGQGYASYGSPGDFWFAMEHLRDAELRFMGCADNVKESPA